MAEKVGYSAAQNVLKLPFVDVMGVWLDAPAETTAARWQLLSRDERARAEKYRFAKDRWNYVTARATLRKLLGERLGISPDAVEFAENEYGKPGLAAAHQAIEHEFNVSHSGALALFSFSGAGEIGVDVELIRDIPDSDDLAECFFSPVEISSLRALPRRGSFAGISGVLDPQGGRDQGFGYGIELSPGRFRCNDCPRCAGRHHQDGWHRRSGSGLGRVRV